MVGGSRVMWLRHFFPREDEGEAPVANCRTMIYGYDTKPERQGVQQISDYADTFLEELRKARRMGAVGSRYPFNMVHPR